jgi:hypothetical protein
VSANARANGDRGGGCPYRRREQSVGLTGDFFPSNTNFHLVILKLAEETRRNALHSKIFTPYKKQKIHYKRSGFFTIKTIH